MSAPASNFQAAMSLMNHTYFNPIIGALVRHGVPDHLDEGPLAAPELAQRAGVDALALTRALRALAGFGTFQEISPGVFGNNPVSNLFRNRPGGLYNFALYNSSDHHVRSAAALGHSVVTGQSATHLVFGDSFWEYARRYPEEGETFNRALAELRGEEHQQIADAYDWTRVNTVAERAGRPDRYGHVDVLRRGAAAYRGRVPAAVRFDALLAHPGIAYRRRLQHRRSVAGLIGDPHGERMG